MVNLGSFSIPNTYAIGGAVTILVVILAIYWLWSRRHQGDRIGLVGELEREGTQMIAVEEQIKKDEGIEKSAAKELLTALLNIDARANSIGLETRFGPGFFKQIVGALTNIIQERISEDQTRAVFAKINPAINTYLGGFATDDKKILQWIAKAEQMQELLSKEISDEDRLFGAAKGLVRRQYEKLRKGKGD